MNINDLYKAIAYAETGHLDDPYIRTQAKGTGSSSYGPVQINKAALTGPGYEDVGFSSELDNWIQNTYLPQMDLFLQYGGDDMIEGMERYDYGQKGDFTEDDSLLYNLMAKQLMQFEYDRVGKDLNKFIEAWRGKSESEDPRYYETVRKGLK